MHDFRDNAATFLLATPAASRGLDLPAVSHVYNLGCPPDATLYLHQAGRAGRIGSPVQGMLLSTVASKWNDLAVGRQWNWVVYYTCLRQ